VFILDGESAANSLAFAADGSRLVVWRHERCLEVWELPTGRRLRTVGPFQYAYNEASFALHPSGRVAFVADHGIGVATLDDPPAVSRVEPGVVNRLIVSPDGEWVIASGRARGEDRLFGLRYAADGSLRPAWEVPPHAQLESVGAFVDSDRFVSVCTRRLVVRHVGTGEEVSVVMHSSNHVSKTAASPDGSRLAAMGYAKVYVWDTATWGKPARVEVNAGDPLIAFAIHPIRPLVAAVQCDQALVKFFDAATGKTAAKFDWKLGEMRSVAFSPDGSLAAAGSTGGKIVVWDVDA
jgi:WD40 repeat protein